MDLPGPSIGATVGALAGRVVQRPSKRITVNEDRDTSSLKPGESELFHVEAYAQQGTYRWALNLARLWMARSAARP